MESTICARVGKSIWSSNGQPIAVKKGYIIPKIITPDNINEIKSNILNLKAREAYLLHPETCYLNKVSTMLKAFEAQMN